MALLEQSVPPVQVGFAMQLALKANHGFTPALLDGHRHLQR
jgi:hypothetical protein